MLYLGSDEFYAPFCGTQHVTLADSGKVQAHQVTQD